jgi:hypothetical protein
MYPFLCRSCRKNDSEAKCLKALESENAKLENLLAEAILDNPILTDLTIKMVTPGVKRDVLTHAQVAFGVVAPAWCRSCG